MELIQCSELSSRLADLNKIQEHITPEGRWWPRARVGSPGPTLVDLLVPHRWVGHDTPNQQGGDHLPASGCPPSPCGSPCIPRALKTQLVHPPKGLAPMGCFPVGRGGDAGLSENWRRGKLMVDLSMAKTNRCSAVVCLDFSGARMEEQTLRDTDLHGSPLQPTCGLKMIG